MAPLLHGAFNHRLPPGSSVFLIHVLGVEGRLDRVRGSLLLAFCFHYG